MTFITVISLGLTFKALSSHRKSEVDFSSKTISLGGTPGAKSRNLDNELVFPSATAGLASLSAFLVS